LRLNANERCEVGRIRRKEEEEEEEEIYIMEPRNMLQSIVSMGCQLNATIHMRSAARGRMINRLERGSTVPLKQTV